MQHELLRVLLDQAVNALLIAAGAEGDGDHRLRLAALEQGRAVHPRQQIDLAGNRAECLVVAAVGTGAGKDLVAHYPRLERLPCVGERIGRDRALGLRVGDQFGDGLLLERGRGLGPGLLALGLPGRA